LKLQKAIELITSYFEEAKIEVLRYNSASQCPGIGAFLEIKVILVRARSARKRFIKPAEFIPIQLD